MSQRIRGQEATIQILVDGAVQAGSFAKVEDFRLTPREDVMETDFLGETETDIDFQHHGYDFSFSIHQLEANALDLLEDIVARERAHTRHPSINIVVTFAYREAAETSRTIVLQSCFIKMNEMGFGGRKEYVKASFEGKCKKVAFDV